MQPNNPRWFAVVAALVTAVSPLAAARYLERTSVRTIDFYGACQKKQWSVTPDGALALVIGAGIGVPCTAELQLADEAALPASPALRFDAQAFGGEQRVQAAFLDRNMTLVAKSEPRTLWGRSETKSIPVEWREGKTAPIGTIRLSVLPGTKLGPNASVAIRRLQWISVPPKPTAKRTIPASVAHAAAAPVSVAPESAHWNYWGVGIAFAIAWLAAGYFLLYKRSAAAKRRLSPLYEINTRTWKSVRDADGVIRIGGLRAISDADLREIRESGFHAIWLMGLWEVGPRVRDISRNYGDDFKGSPYAIYDYAVSQDLGTKEDLDALIARAHAAGLGVVADFVPNHMGIDSAWLNHHPEYFLHKLLGPNEADLPDAELLKRYPSYFPYRTPAYPIDGARRPRTIMVAYGRDPYFFPWIDTAQLDYANPDLRRRMTEVLQSIAGRFDGVRCDMAMLVLREQVKTHRHPDMPWDVFSQRMPEEFWTEAIRSVKRRHPDFVFMAETYWAMEGYLQQLGFDHTYNKPLYESMLHAFHSGHAEGLMNFLRMLGSEFLQKSVHFLENHDEERAMNTFGDVKQRPAAIMLCTLPGVALLHQGQLDGKREKLPVQRVVPLQNEPPNESLAAHYRALLRAVDHPAFREGRFHVLYSNNNAFVTYARVSEQGRAVVIINASDRIQKGVVSLMPNLQLKSGTSYVLRDLYFDLKPEVSKQQPGVQPEYRVAAAPLINQGLYVELQPYDAHLFVIEAAPARLKHRLRRSLRGFNAEWPLPRVARRLFGAALVRSSDRPS